MAIPGLVPAAIGLGSSLIGGLIGQKTKPQFQLSAGQIDNMINAFRDQGLEGLRQLGIQEQQNATSRLAASGLEPSLALQQSLFAPILQSLGSARVGLEGDLAQTAGNLNLARANAQFQADAANPNPFASLFTSIGDVGGLFALRELFNTGGNAAANTAANTTPVNTGGFNFNNIFQPQLGLRNFRPGDRIG